MFVLGIGGMAGSGKTTAADFIEVESINLDCDPIRLSFADPVREQAAAQAGYDDWRIFKKEKHSVYRKLCQTIADEGRPNKWVNIMNDKLKAIEAEEVKDTLPIFMERLVIIDDVRYRNEIDLVKAWAGVPVFINLGARSSTLEGGEWRAHESEWMNQQVEAGRPEYSDLYDWFMFNNKDQLALEKKIEARLDAFCGTSPTRFAKPCDCATCKIFRADIQVEEMVDGFEDAIERANNDPDLEDQTKKDIEEAFQDIIDGLEDGSISPLDVLFEDAEDDMNGLDDIIDLDDLDDIFGDDKDNDDE